MNDMTFAQAATVLNGVVQQMTGQTSLATIATPQDFITVAQTALKGGLDPVLNAIAQLWGRTIFAYREYNGKYEGMRMELERFGNATRKLSVAAAGMEDDESYKWPVAYDAVNHSANPLGNGQSVDMWTISKPDVLQTMFYGTAVWQQTFTIFRDQFDAAFRNADEFARFNTMVLQERLNDRESFREAVARGLQANFIGGIIEENDANRVVHLLTEYNTLTGLTLTSQTVYQPTNFVPFMRWVYARIATLARMFGERSEMFQTVINSKHILRHTTPDRLRIAIVSQAMDQIGAMVKSDTFHSEYLDNATWEGINYWQAIESPMDIDINAVYTDTTGTVTQSQTATQSSVVFGLIHDKDALGYAYVNEWNATTPFNSRGGYWNEDYKARIKTISDNTEKGCVLLLD